jgi:hypothetical protein
MDYYLSVAFYESIWRVVLALLVSAILIACCSHDISSALQIAAHVALLFAVLMIRNAFQLAQMLADYYSHGGGPRRLAQNRPAALMLQFAKGGSAVAIGLYSAALVT